MGWGSVWVAFEGVGEGWSVVAAMVVWVVIHYLVKRGKREKGVDPSFYLNHV